MSEHEDLERALGKAADELLKQFPDLDVTIIISADDLPVHLTSNLENEEFLVVMANIIDFHTNEEFSIQRTVGNA